MVKTKYNIKMQYNCNILQLFTIYKTLIFIRQYVIIMITITKLFMNV